MPEVAKKEDVAGTPAPRYADPFAAFRSEVDRVFENFFGGNGFGAFPTLRPISAGSAMTDISPDIDVKESDKAITVTAELPGIDEKDVEVTLRDRVLTLKGEKKTEREEEKEDLHIRERSYGSFRRSFTLPDTVEEEGVTADFAKGVLTVKIPKSAEAKKAEKKISITAK